MNLSYWEQKSWFTNIDFAIIGSGIVGLSCALELRELHPEAKIVVFEKGMLPSGASTKNAGFACFGSMSEILQDLETHTPSEVVALISSRLNGLSTLRAVLTDQRIAYTQLGGYELFPETDSAVFDRCAKNLDAINELLFPIFNANVFSVVDTPFGFEKVAPKALPRAPRKALQIIPKVTSKSSGIEVQRASKAVRLIPTPFHLLSAAFPRLSARPAKPNSRNRAFGPGKMRFYPGRMSMCRACRWEFSTFSKRSKNKLRFCLRRMNMGRAYRWKIQTCSKHSTNKL